MTFFAALKFTQHPPATCQMTLPGNLLPVACKCIVGPPNSGVEMCAGASPTPRTSDENVGQHVLVMACSATKQKTVTPIPAYKLYRGTFWKILHKQYPRFDDLPPSLTVVIISAKHGVLCPDAPLLPYDRRMTVERAEVLRVAVTQALTPLCQARDVFLCCSPIYRATIDVAWQYPPTFPRGRIGEQAQQFKQWLMSIASRTSSAS